MASPNYGPNPQAFRPIQRLGPSPTGFTPNNYQPPPGPGWFDPYVNQLYPPQPPPQNTVGNGFGNVQNGQRRGALDWLIPSGFGGHIANRDLFGRPIPGSNLRVRRPGDPSGRYSLGPGRPISNYISWNDPRNPNNPANQRPGPFRGTPQRDAYYQGYDRGAGGLGDGFANPSGAPPPPVSMRQRFKGRA